MLCQRPLHYVCQMPCSLHTFERMQLEICLERGFPSSLLRSVPEMPHIVSLKTILSCMNHLVYLAFVPISEMSGILSFCHRAHVGLPHSLAQPGEIDPNALVAELLKNDG